MHLGVVSLVPSQRGMLKSARLLRKDRGDGCQCHPKCHCSRPVSIFHWDRTGWEESSLRAGNARQQPGWEEGPERLFPLTPESDEEQKKVSFLLPSTHQHKCKANSAPKRQSIFTPELSVPPPRHWEPLLPALGEAGCLFPKSCALLQERCLYPSSLLHPLLSLLAMIPLDSSEAALKANLRRCFGLILGP